MLRQWQLNRSAEGWCDPAEAIRLLVSHTVKDLVAGSGIGFKERGTHVLKGLPGEWPLFVVADLAGA
jgi:hypothetical protein